MLLTRFFASPKRGVGERGIVLDKGCIRIAEPKDAIKIAKLLLKAYQGAKEFIYNELPELLWDPDDQNGIVLVACNSKGEIIATIQGNVFLTKQAAESYIHAALPLDDTHFPALYLSHAATDSRYRSIGIHTLMRYYFIDLAQNNEINSLLGIVFQGASRTGLMEKLGYEFVSFDGLDVLTVNPESPILVATLPRDNFSKALAVILSNSLGLLAQYEWKGERLKVSIPSDAPKLQI